MTKDECPERPTKVWPSQYGCFYGSYRNYEFSIPVTRSEQLPPALRAEEEGRPLHQRPTEMPVSRYTGKPGKKPE